MKKQHNKGFTLIELMVTLVIIAILSAIAYPSYNQEVQKSRRSEAITNLLKIQSAYEEYNAQNNTYPAANTLPPNTSIPNTANYSYSSTTTASSYTITATALPDGYQTTDSEQGTSCASMSIDNIGDQTPAVCWSQ